MKIIIIVGLIIIFLMFPYFRFLLFHPIVCGKGIFKDVYSYFKYKRYNECKEYGKVFMFVASGSKAFGSGKTLSMVKWVRTLYKKYNGLPVWDDDTQSFVAQRIIIISNVELKDIPYIPFRGRSQFTEIQKLPHTEHDIIIFCIDEGSTEFNSRNYKDNLPTDFLARLLQVRKLKCSVVLTSQRFGFVDKVLRQICGTVTTCKIWWRIVRLQDYDAYSLENCSNPEMLAPISTRYYFADDSLYHSYDTTYTVEKLKEQLDNNEILDTTEILSRIGDTSAFENASPRLRKKYRERKSK